MTEEELVEHAGEPTSYDEYDGSDDDFTYVKHTYEYQKDSKKYYGQYGYEFEFVNGELEYLYITYK